MVIKCNAKIVSFEVKKHKQLNSLMDRLVFLAVFDVVYNNRM